MALLANMQRQLYQALFWVQCNIQYIKAGCDIILHLYLYLFCITYTTNKEMQTLPCIQIKLRQELQLVSHSKPTSFCLLP